MTLRDQLHNSKTHKPGFDPACPVCVQGLCVDCQQPAVMAVKAIHTFDDTGKPNGSKEAVCAPCAALRLKAEAYRLMPNGGAILLIGPTGVVGDGYFAVAIYPNPHVAKRALISIGWDERAEGGWKLRRSGVTA